MDITIEFTPNPIIIPPPHLPSREIGAALEFHGIVRELENGRALAGLHYEAHEKMARRRLEQHLTELATLHPCAAIHFIHRVGWVPVGEASLYIRILSAHRGEGIALLAATVDRLKQDVPIWKMAQVP
jgi:molybdopterin synthase catalytic subunit